MNCKGKSVNKNQASAQLNRYWHNRTESPHTANAPGFFADREDRDLRRRPKTPATDSARRTSELLKKAITPSRNKAGPALGRAAFRPRLEREARGRTDYRVAADVSLTSRRKVMTCHRSSSGR